MPASRMPPQQQYLFVLNAVALSWIFSKVNTNHKEFRLIDFIITTQVSRACRRAYYAVLWQLCERSIGCSFGSDVLGAEGGCGADLVTWGRSGWQTCKPCLPSGISTCFVQ